MLRALPRFEREDARLDRGGGESFLTAGVVVGDDDAPAFRGGFLELCAPDVVIECDTIFIERCETRPQDERVGVGDGTAETGLSGVQDDAGPLVAAGAAGPSNQPTRERYSMREDSK